MKTVDVLCRIDGHQHALRVHLRRERKLHEDAVDFVAAVEFVDQRQQFPVVTDSGGVYFSL